MPISDLSLTAALKFTFDKAVSGWPDIVQGTNEVTTTLAAVDIAVWDQAYAAVLALNGAGTATVDLQSFTNLAGESVVMDKVFGIIIKVAPTVAADDDCTLTVEPGAANGLVWNMADATIGVNETYLRVEDDDDVTGTVVDATHKTLLFTNTGTDALTATVVILGGT